MKTLNAELEPTAGAPNRAETLLREATRRTEEFLATLGHEMRNPLSALGSALHVWPDAMQDPAQMEELRCIMLRQVRQLTHLSDDLFDVARIARGKIELRREPVGLRQLIDGACEEVRPLIERRGHALTVRIPAEPVMVYGDAPRLLQVFANLLQNAAKFTDRGGSLCVTVEPAAGMAVVRVRDDGPGIEKHRQREIFESTAEVDGSRAPANDGLGIGLRLVKTIVELHGGAVAARSDGPGLGSEFTVRLPVMDGPALGEGSPAARSAAEPDGPVLRPPPHRIVVLDDDRSSAELLARLLRALGQTVSVASDGATAVRLVRKERPQVVFLDIVMRGMDGCGVARRLRGHAELDGLTLIALSGNGDEASRRRALEAGFDKYLVKPTSLAQLAAALIGVPSAIRPGEP